MAEQDTYLYKKHVPREKGIPDQFPFKCYFPTMYSVSLDLPQIMVGIDSGVSNTAFAYINIIRDAHKAITDFEFGDSYYFLDDLDMLALQKDKQIFLCQKYYELFAHRQVLSMTFERLSLNTIRDTDTLKGVIDAQETTTLLTTTAYALNHFYKPIPATSIKYCLTGNGKADKQEMCQAAYNLTGDIQLLNNSHRADAFACCFYSFIQGMKESCVYYEIPIPSKYAHMEWNFRTMPKAPWEH